MGTCPACGKELPGSFPFCPFCAAPLAAQPDVPAQEERKVVTVLFCDLVGFTAASEAADPEDVRSRIRPYHASLRSEIERYGGTVEKFIGDAVMAVFGAPVAHEDDAERAVRAGLRILEAMAELNEQDASLSLQVRIGINTGVAVVALGARPQEGEGFVTGDVVNTASRIQGAAPVDAIACAEQTYRATERVFDYEQLPAVTVKGKPEPVAIFRPLRARARLGADVIRSHTTPLVGRQLERPLLIGAFERSAQQRSCQLVTIAGEPGVGKSRLCTELVGHIDDRPGLVRWRKGRCLPYGEGIAFWALGEIVKAECGILESDSPEEADGKLERALPADDPDRAWLKSRLASLVGAGGEPASQEESFTAWRRVLESWADDRETVLMFDDLHWADETLLSFLEHLAEWSQGVPLLLLCTARPELYERHPNWAAGLRNATTISLCPLTDVETARLIGSLLQRAVLPAETQRALLERAGGNPLYAEEFVRLLADRGQLGGDAVEVPASVQALIAARLDTLSAERKGLLQHAAVIGQVFWAGALAEMAGLEPRDVEQALHELSRKELVRPARRSTMEGEAEYSFSHLLVRDVCYGQIPRARRADRHQAVAAWLEGKAGERVEDLADVLAYHYTTALELARACGEPQTRELEASAIHYLALAGARALALDAGHAEQHLAHALDLAPAEHPDRPAMLEGWAQAAQARGRFTEAKDAVQEALNVYRSRGDCVAAGRALFGLGILLRNLGDPGREEVVAEGLALLEAQPPGPELVAARADMAAKYAIGHARFPESVAAAERTIALAAELGLPEPARALGYRGYARCCLGERQGIDDMRRAIELAIEQGQGRAAAIIHSNLAVVTWQYEGPQAALDACREGIDFCERCGNTEVALSIASMSAENHGDLGHTEQALAEAKQLAERSHKTGTVYFIRPRSLELRLLAERGAHAQATAADELAAAARSSDEPQGYARGFTAAARLLLTDDRAQHAEALLLDLATLPDVRADPNFAAVLPELVRTALAVSGQQLAARLVDGVQPTTPGREHALCAARAQLAEAAGEHAEAADLYAEAAARWQTFGHVPERAYALLGHGRCLRALGRPEARESLHEAQALFAAMGYAPALTETGALLGECVELDPTG